MGRWRLDPAEVSSGWEATSEPAGNGHQERLVWLEHAPSGLRVEAPMPLVPGVPDEPPVIEAVLRKGLFAELELKVALHLGIHIQPK